KAFLKAYIQESTQKDSFSRFPDAAFDAFGVDEHIRQALVNRDFETIRSKEGDECIELLVAATASQPFDSLFYPNPNLWIAAVETSPNPIRSNEDGFINVFVRWDHEGELTRGFPPFIHLILDPLAIGNRLELSVVPAFFNASEAEMRLRGELR